MKKDCDLTAMIGRIIKIRILRPRDSKNIQHKLMKLVSLRGISYSKQSNDMVRQGSS